MLIFSICTFCEYTLTAQTLPKAVCGVGVAGGANQHQA